MGGGERALTAQRSFGSGLLFDVLLNNGKRGATATGNEVGSAPKNWLFVNLVQRLAKLLAQKPAGYGLEVIGDDRRCSLWVHFQQEVNMVGLAIHFDQSSFP